MMEWINMLMQPSNQGALLNTLAQKSAPPMEALQALQAQGAPQMSQIPGAPDSFVGMLQQAGGPGMVPMQPGPNGNLMPVPAPQMSIDPNAPQGPAPIPFAPEAAKAPYAGLKPEQLAKLMAGGQSQDQQPPRAPPPPGLMGGSSVRAPEMLQTAAGRPQGRATLAQLIYGR